MNNNISQFRVGNWTVEPELGRVHSGNLESSLQPQVMQLLVFLSEHPGEVISIERMIDEVWRGKPMTSGSVYNALNTLRKTFGDNKDTPIFIETIPRRGYRLIAAVRKSVETESSASPAPREKPPESAPTGGMFEELKRRNVFRVGIAYVLSAWVLLQITDVLAQLLELPEVIGRVVVLLLVVGFVLALIFAWAYEMTPQGLQRDSGVVSGQPDRLAGKMGWIALVLTVAVMTWVSGRLAPEPGSLQGSAVVPEKSIAVLPFADLSPEGDQQYFAEGIAEEILNVISRHPDLKVVGRSSSFMFRDGAADLKEVGQKLGVAHVLEGSVRRDGNLLRITAQLIETEGGYHLWSQTYDIQAGGIFQIQDEIAGKIAEQLQVSVLGQEAMTQLAVQRAPDNLDAHDLYLLARYRVQQGGTENVAEAIVYLEQALDIDPDYALAHVELAWALLIAPSVSREEWQNRRKPGGLIEQRAQMALAIDPSLSGAYAVQANVNWINAMAGKFLPESAEKAEHQFIRALDLNPNDARALVGYSGLLRFQGKPYGDSINLGRRAMELEPLMPFAVESFFTWIKDLPRFRVEKWEIIQRITSGVMDWNEDIDMFLARMFWLEGQLGEAMLSLNKVVDDEFGFKPLLGFHIAEGLGQLRKAVNQGVNAGSLQTRTTDTTLYEMIATSGQYSDCVRFPDTAMEVTHRLQACVNSYLLTGEFKQAGQLLSEFLPEDEAVFNLQYRFTFDQWTSVAMSLASLYKLNEDQAGLQRQLDGIDSFMNGVYSDPDTIGHSAMTTLSLLDALRGDQAGTIARLREAIEMGQRDWRVLMHPAFDEIRKKPEFIEVLEHWITQVNEDRAMLDLVPRQLNYDVGPGVLPFVLEEGELESLLKGLGEFSERVKEVTKR